VKRDEKNGRIIDDNKECEMLRRGEKETLKKDIKEQPGLSTWTLNQVRQVVAAT
jgi:hypothetical protein